MKIAFLWLFLASLALSIPVIFGLLGTTGLVITHNLGAEFDTRDLNSLISQLFSGMSSVPLMALPMFILAGELMNTGGITGRLYQQFAITIAVSVGFSTINALTLSPALASKLLRPKTGKSPLERFYRGFNRVFDWATGIYLSIARALVQRQVFGLLLIFAVLWVISLVRRK